ncbi:MAG: thioredoxin family protein [Oligoflexia bacterium]|nr:thioredoxin family protein [Oligoflexia bacterium]
MITALLMSFAIAANEPDIKFSEQKTKAGLIEFQAPLNHHFNQESPNRITLKGEVGKLEFSDHIVKVQYPSETNMCQPVEARLFICDDKKTYCLERRKAYSCENGKWRAGNSKNYEGQKETAQASSVFEGFIVNDPVAAVKLANETKKPMLIDFFGIWCPPCNQLDEQVFSSPSFRKIADSFVLLKLDADKEVSWELKSKYKVTGYPTIIFADHKGEELNRIIGARERPEFLKTMAAVLANQAHSEPNLRKRADAGELRAAHDLGKLLLGREEYSEALTYLLKASQGWKKSDPGHDDLLEAQLGVASRAKDPDAKIQYVKLLKQALELQPKSKRALERSILVAQGAEETQGAEAARAYHLEVIRLAKERLKNAKLIQGTEWNRGDLYSVIAEQYESMGDAKASAQAYGQAAWEFGQLIKKAGLQADRERGHNLNRLYCLWKSGKQEQAHREYSRFEKLFPEEFTFYYQHARMMHEWGNPKEALELAKKAFQYSYGDNRLRVAALLAGVHLALDDKKSAESLLNEVMGQTSLPKDARIRTHRYYEKLKQLKAQIDAAQKL